MSLETEILSRVVDRLRADIEDKTGKFTAEEKANKVKQIAEIMTMIKIKE